jgi:NAD(P)-dependent dehydrogenase (short-subunit alcohol dehydrogenase family)
MAAKSLAAAGAKVYILGRRVEVLENAAAQCSGLHPLQCDVTSKESLQAAVDIVGRESGFVNLVMANSGIIGPVNGFNPDLSIQELRKSLFDQVDMADFTHAFHVNTTAAYFTMLAFLELLDAGNKMALEGGFGAPVDKEGRVPSIQSQVILTTSVSAYSRQRASPPAYAGSKSALAHLLKHSSTNLAPYEIRVNGLAPGC